MRISDWSSDVCSSDLDQWLLERTGQGGDRRHRSLELLAIQEKPLRRRGVVGNIICRVDRQREGEQSADGAAPRPVVAFVDGNARPPDPERTCRKEEHTSELQSLMRISFAHCWFKKQRNSAS